MSDRRGRIYRRGERLSLPEKESVHPQGPRPEKSQTGRRRAWGSVWAGAAFVALQRTVSARDHRGPFSGRTRRKQRAHASEQPIRRQQIASLHPAFWVGSGRGGQPQREPMSVFGRAHSACCSAPLCAASSAQLPQHICSLRSAYRSLRPFLLASGPGGRDHEHGAAPEPCRLSSFTSPSQRGFRPLSRQASSDTSYPLGAHVLRGGGFVPATKRSASCPAKHDDSSRPG